MQPKRDERPLGKTIEKSSEIARFINQASNRINPILDHGPYIVHDNPHNDVHQRRDDRHKTASAEKGEHLRKLYLVVAVMKSCDSKTDENTSENPHLKRHYPYGRDQ